MSTIIKCDRCKTEGDYHTRHLEITQPEQRSAMDDDREFDLCGFCASQFRLFMKNEPTTRIEGGTASKGYDEFYIDGVLQKQEET